MEMLLKAIFVCFLFFFGSAVGSFIGALVWRLRNKRKISKGRSFCPNCKKKLGVMDLFPIFSYLFLRGKCRYCNKQISLHYFLSELFTAVAFTLIGLSIVMSSSGIFMKVYSHPLDLLAWMGIIACILGIVSVLVLGTIYDLWYMEVPQKVLPYMYLFALGFVVFFILSLLTSSFPWAEPFEKQAEIIGWLAGIDKLGGLTGALLTVAETIFSSLLGCLLMFLFFFTINRLTKQKGMGFGDVVFAPAVGVWLGGILSLVALLLSFVLGSIISVVWALVKHKKIKGVLVPYLPFLCASALLVFVFSADIMDWWINYLFLW